MKTRLTSVLAFAGVLTAGGLASADPTFEVGGTVGAHIFSDENELGVFDQPGAASESNTAMFGLRLGAFFKDTIGIEGEFAFLPSSARMLDFSVSNITYRGHLVAELPTKGKVVPFLVGGVGAFLVTSTDQNMVIYKDLDAAWYFGAGVKYRLPHNWGIRGDARLLLPPSSQSDGATTDFEFLASFYKEFGREKKVDDDPDRDGIRGAADKCPMDPEDKDGFEDTDGCPELDNDHDGIPDSTDKCPNDPEDKDGFEDTDGCPDLDNDKDGLADNVDKCPTDPEDKDGFEDDDGCPDTDNDKDGVADNIDKCPNEAETKNGFEDDDGCPDTVPNVVKQFTGAIAGVNFKTGEAVILATSNATLDVVAKVLTEYPNLKLEIQGHTDDKVLMKGSKYADNQELSQARAEAVKAYLVKKGIAADRLTAKGFGDSQPVAPIDGLKGNDLENARTKNRRVEFHVIQ